MHVSWGLPGKLLTQPADASEGSWALDIAAVLAPLLPCPEISKLCTLLCIYRLINKACIVWPIYDSLAMNVYPDA